MRRALLLLAVAACPAPPRPPPARLADSVASADDDETRIARLVAELREDILLSYERDEPPETETGMLDPTVGAARIGVGPGDFLITSELERAPSRWPLFVARDARTGVVSKRLEIHVAQDQSAAWMSDELSWRIGMCSRTAVMPLRATALYAHDGDRWVPVFEHLSFGRAPAPELDGELYGKTVAPAIASRDLADELSRGFSPLLSRGANRKSVAIAPEAVLLGPDVGAEWHGAAIASAQVLAGTVAAEDRRVGFIGRSLGRSTVAYWIGNIVADLPARPGVAAGKVRLRATFVFEKRRLAGEPGAASARSCADDPKDCRWLFVQGHVSAPEPDDRLATAVFGTALVSLNPLALTCDDGTPAAPPPKVPTPPRRPTKPAVGPVRDRATPPAPPLTGP